MSPPRRRKGDVPSWEKVAHNIVLVGSVVAALGVVFSLGVGYTRQQGQLEAMANVIQTNTTIIANIEVRLKTAEAKISERGPRIEDNAREIERLRNKGIVR